MSLSIATLLEATFLWRSLRNELENLCFDVVVTMYEISAYIL